MGPPQGNRAPRAGPASIVILAREHRSCSASTVPESSIASPSNLRHETSILVVLQSLQKQRKNDVFHSRYKYTPSPPCNTRWSTSLSSNVNLPHPIISSGPYGLHIWVRNPPNLRQRTSRTPPCSKAIGRRDTGLGSRHTQKFILTYCGYV